MKIEDSRGKYRERTRADRGLAEAAAQKVRRDFPTHTVDLTAHHYGLTTGEAKGVVYGTASRSTIDKMLKRGGWALVVELGAIVVGQPLEKFIEQQAEEARRERAEWEARERRLERMDAHLRDRNAGGGGGGGALGL